MKAEDTGFEVRRERDVPPGVDVIRLTSPERDELFVTATPEGVARTAHLLSSRDVTVISQEVFGIDDAIGPVDWPVTTIRNKRPSPPGFGGIQTWALRGADVETLRLGDRVVGRVWSDSHATYCRMGNLQPTDPHADGPAQARSIYKTMEATLRAAGMDISHVVRTWFYFEEILSWYDGFNEVRDAFFQARRIFDGLVPASTGMGGPNRSGSAVVLGLLAIRPRDEQVVARPVASPLQCPAIEYGSSFSRAVELAFPDHRRLFVSGTASIAPEGDTIHVGDVDGQIETTLDVVEAILASRGATWRDSVRALAYLKRPEDRPQFERALARRGIESIPVVCSCNDVCRDDLLFEFEVDAITSAHPRPKRT